MGLLGSVVILWGWWVQGPVRLAAAEDESAKHAIYVRSLQQRAIICGFVTCVLVTLAVLWSKPGWTFVTAMMVVGGASLGLSPSWYPIGIGRPLHLALFDDLPTVVLTGAAAVLILLGCPIWVYPVALVASGLISPIAYAYFLDKNWVRLREPLKQSILGIRAQTSLAAANFIGIAYTSTPIPIANARSSATEVPGFVSGLKVFSMATYSIVALANALQSWVLEARHRADQFRRYKVAIISHLALGTIGGACISLLTPFATRILFGRSVEAPQSASMLLGIAYFCVCVSTPLSQNILIPNGRTRSNLWGGVAAAVVGFPLMLFAAGPLGVTGAALGLAISEAVVLSLRVITSFSVLREIREGPNSEAMLISGIWQAEEL